MFIILGIWNDKENEKNCESSDLETLTQYKESCALINDFGCLRVGGSLCKLTEIGCEDN